MLAQSITGTGKIRLTQRFGRLEFYCKMVGLASPVLLGNIRTALNDLRIQVFRISPSGSFQLMQETPLFDMLTIATANEGLIKKMTRGGTPVVTGTIELSDHGSLAVLDNDYYEVVITGTWLSGMIIDVYAVDYDTLTQSHNLYEVISCDANAPREINVSNAKLIAFPKANLSSLEFLMSDGTRVRYEPAECESIVRDGLETVAIDEGKALTMDDFDIVVMNVAAALTVKFTFTAITVIRKVSSVNIVS